MHLIIYLSEYTGTKETIQKDLEDICSIAKRNNTQQEISGVLFYHNNHFLQAIEGERETLENLMLALSKDKRHKNIIRIIDDKISERCFKNWNMDSFNLNEQQYIDVNIVNYLKELSYEYISEIETEVFIYVLKDFLMEQ